MSIRKRFRSRTGEKTFFYELVGKQTITNLIKMKYVPIQLVTFNYNGIKIRIQDPPKTKRRISLLTKLSPSF